MNEQHPRRQDGPWTEGGHDDRGRSALPDHLNPTEQFPTASYPAEQFPAERPPFARPVEPLAHEGGFPYGMPPAAPYGAPSPYGYGDPYIPQHLHVPPPQFRPGPYPQQFGYPPMQQAVYVHGAPAKRVNHALHLVLTIVTFGLWLPVWIILAIANS